MTITNLGVTTALVCALTLSGCSGSDESDADQDASPIPAESPTTTAELLSYTKGGSPGVEVQSSADAQELAGAPADFQEFVGTLADDLAQESTCEDGFVGVTVQVVRTDGFARGGVNDCGGYAALWVKVDGTWQEVAGSQDVWECVVLEDRAIPSDVAGTECYDPETNDVRTYEQA